MFIVMRRRRNVNGVRRWVQVTEEYPEREPADTFAQLMDPDGNGIFEYKVSELLNDLP